MFEFLGRKKDWTVELLIVALLSIYTIFGTLFMGIDGFIRNVYNSGWFILTFIALVGIFGTIIKNYVEGQKTWGADFKMLGLILVIVGIIFIILPAGALRVNTYKATGIIGIKNPSSPRVYLLGVENFKPQTFSPAFSLAPTSIWEGIVGAKYNARVEVTCGGQKTFEKGIDVRLGGLLGEQKKKVRTDIYKIKRAEKCKMRVNLQHFGETVSSASFTFNSPGKTVEV